MPDEIVKRKLIALASRIKGRDISLAESSAIAINFSLKAPRTPGDLEAVLAESLYETNASVHIKLAAHDDSDRLIREIVTALGK